MFYIFNENHVCIGFCDSAPDEHDLSTRSEHCRELQTHVKIGDILEGDELIKPPVSQVPEVDYTQLATALKDKLRSNIDLYVLPTSTIGENLVTEEQKATLVQDSLLLARWPSISNWPFVDLPNLSDLTKSIIQVPAWDYPTNLEVNVEV